MSQSAASPKPPPTQRPSISATTGCRHARTDWNAGFPTRAYSRAFSAELRVASNSEMSAPAEKARPPAPRSTTHRRSASRSHASMISRSRRDIATDIALSFSGRFSTTVAIGPSRVT